MAKRDQQSSVDRQKNMRSARAEKQQQEHAEKLAQLQKDRRNQTIIGVVVVAIIVVLIGIVGFNVYKSMQPVQQEDQSATIAKINEVSDKPSKATDKYGFIVSKNGLNKPVKNVPTVQVYLDFMCPGCAMFENTFSPTFTRMVEAGQMNLELHPLAFLERMSPDEYSSRAGSMFVYILEHDETHALSFMSKFFEHSFQPQEGSNKKTSDQALVDQAVKAGVSREVAEKAVKFEYKPWIKAITEYTVHRAELQHQSGQFKGSMTTPTVVINNRYWDLSKELGSTTDPVPVFLKAIGLSENAVGNPNVLPSIGADREPIGQ